MSTKKPDRPKVTGVAVTCGHCGNRTLMTIVAQHADTRTHEVHGGPPTDEGEEFDLLKCPACSRINLRLIQWDEWRVEVIQEQDGSPEAELGEIVYPAPPSVPEGLPPAVRAAYEEALAVRAKSPNAYSVMLGRVLEVVCKDRDAAGNTLYDQIASLRANDELPEKLVAVAHGIRKLRNKGAHAAIGSLTAKDVPVIERLTRAVLEFVYTAPHLARRAERAG